MLGLNYKDTEGCSRTSSNPMCNMAIRQSSRRKPSTQGMHRVEISLGPTCFKYTKKRALLGPREQTRNLQSLMHSGLGYLSGTK